MSTDFWLAVISAQCILLPINGLVWLAKRRENQKQEALLRQAVKAIYLVGITRGGMSR